MRRITITTTALVLLLAGSARAQDTTITSTLTPNTPGAGSKLHLEVSGTAPELGGALPESVALDVQRGFKLDLRSRAQRCTGAALTSGACPSASRIGTGQAVVAASGLLNQDIPATIKVFLAAPMQAGDLASAVVVLSAAGLTGVVRSRLLKLTDPAFAYQLRLDGFAGSVPTFPGVTFALRSLTLDVGARRTVTKRVRVTRKGKRVTVKRKVRYDLLRNPATCPAVGAWAARLTLRVAGTDRVRVVGVPCSQR